MSSSVYLRTDDMRLQPVDLGSPSATRRCAAKSLCAVEADRLKSLMRQGSVTFAVLECRGGYCCAAASAKNGRPQCWHVMVRLAPMPFRSPVTEWHELHFRPNP
jgi:hypothetical protein